MEEVNVIVKGYIRPDGSSYQVAVPKPIREALGLVGGEYFKMKAKPEEKAIKLKLLEPLED